MLSTTAALCFLPCVIVIGIWVSWNDMKFMKIPNKAVMALWAVWLLVGGALVLAGVFSWQIWAWGWALAAIVMVVGFLANALNLMGAGDAKFLSAMAPFFVTGNISFIMGLFAACLLGAFAAHRLAGRIPAVRASTTEWLSWTHKDFPMGLALSGTLIFYHVAALLPLF
jgi:prepilin peptidase CpaA